MTVRRVLAFLGSAGIHACAIAALLALAASLRETPPLFVDLTGGGPAGEGRAADAPAAKREAARGVPRQVSRAIARLLRPAGSPPPAPAAPAAPARPAEPAPALAPAPAPLPAPPPTFSASREAAPAAEGAPAIAADSTGREAKGVSSDGPARPGQPSGAVGGSGALLALAGTGAGRSDVPAEYGPYLTSFRERIQESVVYPFAARRRGEAGRVEVELLLEPSGRVRELSVVSSSSHALLDEAAVDAVRSVRPVPLPDGLPRRPLRVRLPVIFQLR